MAENIFTIMTDDVSVAQQYRDTFRRSEHLEPEKALLAAMLEDAVHDYRKYAQARDRDGRERFREAEDWLMENANDWIFSFRHVCEYLGLDPDYVQRGLREAKGKIAAEEKPRPRHKTHRRAA
ncbi:MAG TPA: hypothetical protein VMT22_03895 [Terriglobales bacterium]|jgi:hypothetical protein|nr:hypothetical protein [Terriglobales bacterium]